MQGEISKLVLHVGLQLTHRQSIHPNCYYAANKDLLNFHFGRIGACIDVLHFIT